MKLSIRQTAFGCYFFALILFCLIYQNTMSGSTANQEENGQKEQSETVQPSEQTIVGKIEDYTITRQELEKRLLSELQPDPYKIYTAQTKPGDANSILLQMLGEKALIIDARKQGILEEEAIRQTIKNYRQQQLISLWARNNATKAQDKIAASEDEIDKQIKSDPKMNRERAKSVVESAKANKINDQFYEDLYKKSEVKKVTENFSKAIEIHNRLLNYPKTTENSILKYIRNYQVRDELTDQEKNIVLATFSRGNVTLKDWFETLCDYSPRNRPDNLNTEKGIDQLLEQALFKPLIVAEAQAMGLDKDPVFLRQMRDMEDETLLNAVRSKKYEELNIKEPNKEEIAAFYDKNKEYFVNRMLKIDQIWCKDQETAKRVKAEINSGKDFNEAKKEYSLFPDGQAYQAYPGTEGYFWNDLWAGEPNYVTGPVKGFHSGSVKWRIVKILEKQKGEQKEFSPEIENNIISFMMSEKAYNIMIDYCLSILKKYHYEIYFDKIKDINPMNIK
ncbi:MAG: peptidyl-prolyl cis-trans isomerase [Sedimentisphaerales bacterium]|nr:peptidyl-prolyl cis-trans isomerase [Sedimentisphaerales bacterium]